MVSTVTCERSGAFGVLPRVNNHLEQNNGLGPERDLKQKFYHMGKLTKPALIDAPQLSYKRQRSRKFDPFDLRRVAL